MSFAHKAIAVPYIIALVIGLIILAILVYWVFRTATSPTISVEQCKSRYITWCSNCAQMGWPAWHCMPDAVKECEETLKKIGLHATDPGCSGQPDDGCNNTNVKEDCAALGVCLNNPEC